MLHYILVLQPGYMILPVRTAADLKQFMSHHNLCTLGCQLMTLFPDFFGNF